MMKKNTLHNRAGLNSGKARLTPASPLRVAAVATLMALAAYNPTEALALGLGRITVLSALGEPLRAEIDIAQITPDEVASLKASIAAPSAYRSAGVEYNPALLGAAITIEQRPDGRSFLRLTSDKRVSEPFVDLILEANWASGRIVRDYTLLFDPPSTRQAAPAAPVAAQLPAQAASRDPSPPRAGEVPRSAPTAAPAAPVKSTRTPPASVATPRPPAPSPVERAASDGTPIKVKAGDTAGKIAVIYKPADVSLEQMLVAMLRTNPDAFINGNVNRIKAGAVVELPTAAQASSVTADEARQTLSVQSTNFNEYRRKLAEGAPTRQLASADRQVSGGLQTRVEEKKPAAASPDKLTLSKGAVKGTAPEAQIAQSRQTREASERVAELSKNITELSRLQEKPAATGGAGAAAPVASGARAPTLPVGTPASAAKPAATPVVAASAPVAPAASAVASPAAAKASAPAAAVKPTAAAVPASSASSASSARPPASSASAVASPAAPASASRATASAPSATSTTAASATPTSTTPTSTTASASTPAAALSPAAPASAGGPAVVASAAVSPPKMPASASKPVATATPAAAETSLVDEMLDNPLIPAVAGGLIALLAGFGFYRARQRKKSTQVDSSFLESRLQPDSFFGSSGGQRVDTADAAPTGSSLAYSPSQLDAAGDVDPVAEADVYLAYGRDLQAEEILKEALRMNPSRIVIHSKLLEIYAKRRDSRAFEMIARDAYKLSGGEGAEWEHICEFGRELDSENPLYQPGGQPQGQGGKSTVAESESPAFGSSTIPVAPHPEFDASMPVDLDLGDLDLSFDSPAPPAFDAGRTVVTEPQPAPAAADAGLDWTPPSTEAMAAQTTPLAPLIDVTAIDFPLEPEPAAREADEGTADAGMIEFDLGSLSLDLDRELPRVDSSDGPTLAGASDPDPLQTKLDLAQEFHAIGDTDGARALVEEVVSMASGPLKAKAQRFLSELG